MSLLPFFVLFCFLCKFEIYRRQCIFLFISFKEKAVWRITHHCAVLRWNRFCINSFIKYLLILKLIKGNINLVDISYAHFIQPFDISLFCVESDFEVRTFNFGEPEVKYWGKTESQQKRKWILFHMIARRAYWVNLDVQEWIEGILGVYCIL